MYSTRGDFIAGRFVLPVNGEALTSTNPARDHSVVLETRWDVAHAEAACEAAHQAWPGWSALSREARWSYLERFRDALRGRKRELADAIRLEAGKIQSESLGEAGAVIGRFDIIRGVVEAQLKDGPLPGFPSEIIHHHPHGVVAVLGPFNFPVHLCNAHILPALLLGNTVVLKPSEVTPLCGQVYAEAAAEAGFPPGVFNLVQGGGAVGAALVGHPNVRGLCFTGSYATGRRIQENALDRPELLLALEMGGKNTAVVLDDADLEQAAHELLVGGYLTTGQRCTATDRVLVHRRVFEPLVDALRAAVPRIRFGDPESPDSFAGPMTTASGREHFLATLERARSLGVEALVEGGARAGEGLFVEPSLHVLPEGTHEIPGYTDEELFGPDLCVAVMEDDDEIVEVMLGNPYGLANTVFTRDESRFKNIRTRTHAGLLNWNRTTNQASPRLPFGGVGRSGNFRPAGAAAPLNLVYPVATRTNLPGEFVADPRLIPLIPAPDLDVLEDIHAKEERVEAGRRLLTTPRIMRLIRPEDGHLPESERWRARLYAGDRMAREKKPGVFDHLRSVGPWMVSIDETPLSVVDGMSQTATVCAGFAEDEVVREYIEGKFGDADVCAHETTLGEHPAVEAYAARLREILPALPHVSFTNSGAEANEKAYALARLHAPEGARRLLAFEGSFHGRTLLALHASFNPKKRAPFELSGYEVTFAPFPVRPDRRLVETPAGFLERIAEGDLEGARACETSSPALLSAELDALDAVHAALSSGEYFACVIEPMQSEGGDRYASGRFFRALRLLTRHHETPLIFDEVQVGFGLGGDFLWHKKLKLVARDGTPDHPDAVVFAKRAQVGVCVSRFEDPEPTSAHVASLIRGRIHAEMMSSARTQTFELEAIVRPRLEALAKAYPHLVSKPRCSGHAIAFDLPSPELLSAYIGQRFWRGVIVFAAGTHTVRYRLNNAFDERALKRLFEAIRRSLSWLDAHPGARPPAWENQPASRDRQPGPEYRVRRAEPSEGEGLMPRLREIEAAVYEPERRDSIETLGLAFEDMDGVAIVAEHRASDSDSWRVVGFALAAPLERVTHLDGPNVDPMRDRNNTLYSVSITIDSEHQGQRLGRALKREQLSVASSLKAANGEPRYEFAVGRNRMGRTRAMTRLNRLFGAQIVDVYENQYGREGVRALYYRIPLRGLGAPLDASEETTPSVVDLAGTLSCPLQTPPASLQELKERGALTGPTVNKITLCNYITPAIVRAVEWVSALTPTMPHLFWTSSRDETFDKATRILRFHRKRASIVIGLDGGYVGHTTAAARSLSDPGVHRQGAPYFDWPRLPHPAEVGSAATIEALREVIEASGGAEHVLGLIFEVVQERTGRVIPEGFWAALAAERAQTGVPVVLVETSTAYYRSGQGAFASSGLDFEPDLLTWWCGGQQGFIHATSPLFVSTPLMMVSTWDGDELSMIRAHHQLRAARQLDIAGAVARLDQALSPLAAREDVTLRGAGLYRVLSAGEQAEAYVSRFTAAGLRATAWSGGRIAIAPPLDAVEEACRRLEAALS